MTEATEHAHTSLKTPSLHAITFHMSGGQDCNLWILREHSSANAANKRKPVRQLMAPLYNRINAIEPLKEKAAPKS